ncbi:uncharacterized protein LOC132269779 [Cornus florida]|uniref:uncharacterized protein LOC132269779 n=1 Tax=Cornus florida TaxID=4283 RepID=UPI00289D8229|nr:uncharacterized protein LOC132269779 [Cornus florida]
MEGASTSSSPPTVSIERQTPLSPRHSWRSCFEGSDATSFINLQYIPPGEGSKVSITEEDVADEILYWTDSVVGYVMGKRPYYPHFKAFIEKHWSKDVTLVYLKNGFFMVRFQHSDDVQKVLSCIHTFEGRVIIIKKWSKNVILQRENFDTLPIWIRVHDLPVHCRNSTSLSKVCSLFSKPISMDDPALHRDKDQYVRVMVEVDVHKDLPEDMVVDFHGEDCKVHVEYEWKPIVCSVCKRVDHAVDRCPQRV